MFCYLYVMLLVCSVTCMFCYLYVLLLICSATCGFSYLYVPFGEIPMDSFSWTNRCDSSDETIRYLCWNLSCWFENSQFEKIRFVGFILEWKLPTFACDIRFLHICLRGVPDLWHWRHTCTPQASLWFIGLLALHPFKGNEIPCARLITFRTPFNDAGWHCCACSQQSCHNWLWSSLVLEITQSIASSQTFALSHCMWISFKLFCWGLLFLNLLDVLHDSALSSLF